METVALTGGAADQNRAQAGQPVADLLPCTTVVPPQIVSASGRARFHELDALRGFAALAVLLHHNLAAAGLLVGPVVALIGRTPLHALVDGRQAVIFFFVLSGFVLTGPVSKIEGRVTLRRWMGWAAQRTIRLGAPVLVAVALSVLLYASVYDRSWAGESGWLRDYVWQEPPSVTAFLGQALLLRSAYRNSFDNTLWSLAIEWRLSILFPLLALVPALRGRAGGFATLLVGLILAFAVGEHFNQAINLNPGLVGQLRATAYFVLPFTIGIALHRYRVWEIQPGEPLRILALAALLVFVAAGSDDADYLAAGLLIWLAMQHGRVRDLLRTRVPQLLGKLSFSLYLVHVPVIALVFHGLHGRLSAPAMLLISCPAAIVASYLFYVAFERPAHRFAHALGSRLLA